MSAEVLTTVIAFAALLVAIGSGFGWMIRRSDAQFHTLDTKIDTVERTLAVKIDGQGRDITEIKITIARLEGPRPRLIPIR